MNQHENSNTNHKNFPYDIKPLDPSIARQISNDFTGEKSGFVQIGPKNYFLPATFRELGEQMYNFDARPDDIWIATCPRSGTTMTQEMVWLLTNDFDYDRAQRDSLGKRVPFFEYCLILNNKLMAQIHNPANKNTLEDYAKTSSRRYFKTHLPFSLMPPSIMEKQAKIIYIARHPKDVVVSWYHANRAFKNHGYVNDFAHFYDYFERGLTSWGPYWEHVKEGWENRSQSNVLFLFYEDLVKDMPTTILKIAAFLNKEVNDENLQRLVDHLKIDNFRNNAAVNLKAATEFGRTGPISNDSYFIRNGKVSGSEWQKEYTPELIERAEKWFEKNLGQTTLKFPEY